MSAKEMFEEHLEQKRKIYDAHTESLYRTIFLLKHKIAIAIEALEELSVCGGWCDGPMGCGCNAPIAKKAIKKILGEI